MRYINSKGVETNSSSSYTIWSAGNLQAPTILKTIQNPNGAELSSITNEFSNLYSLESVSSSQKRKILDCDRGEYDERFSKMQRIKLLQKVAAKANLVIDDEASDDEEDRIYEQMDWIERESDSRNMFNWDSSDEEDDGDESFEEIIPNSPLLFVPRLKWKEERRRLLRISMAKIRRVEDPESYLRRSVLINNTVKRLQKDVAMSVAYHSDASTSSVHVNFTYQNEGHDSLLSESTGSNLALGQPNQNALLGADYSASLSSETIVQYDDHSSHQDLSCNPVQFHLAFASSFFSDKDFDVSRQELTHNLSKNTAEEQKLLNDVSMSPFVLKQPSPLHLFSSQPCGLQYRSHVQDEDAADGYSDSSSPSSLLDSVVYHSLVASLET